MLLQALRFKYFIRHFLGYDVASTGKTVTARLAGEFVTQTTPSYVGGELVRIAWLSKNGVPPGKAAWVTTMEIIADVFVGAVLAFIGRRTGHLPVGWCGWIGRNSNNDPNLSRLVGAYTLLCQTHSSPPVILSEGSGKVPVKKKGREPDQFS